MRRLVQAALFVILAGAVGPPRAEAGEGEPATAPSAPDADLPKHAAQVASYNLRAKLDTRQHTVHGEGTIAWTNRSAVAKSELWFHLYLNAFKNQSSVFMRAPIGGFRGSTIPSDWGAIDVVRLAVVDGEARIDLTKSIELRRPGDDDETDARVPLPNAVEPGQSITLEVEWNDKLPAIVERTGYHDSFHMIAQWFPKIARLEESGEFAHFPFHHLGEFYADFGSYDVTLDVPKGFVVGATGRVTESRDEGDRHIERRQQDDVHDFAWTAWDQWQTRSETIAGVTVTVLTPPHYEDHAERELETMRFALPHYGARYGPYPYPVLTIVHPPALAPEAGGMEYPTLITTGGPSWLPRGIHLVEQVTIHEFGHQYFYGLLASNEDAWPFLDEGLNQWAETEAMTRWKGAGSGIDYLGIAVGESEWHGERGRHAVHDERVAQAAQAFDTGASYGALAYSRTAAILATLSRTYGPDKLERALGLYARRFRFAHPTPDDLLAVIQEVLGPQAKHVLRTALFDKGWVDFTITQASSHPSRASAGIFDRDGKRETVRWDGVGNRSRYVGSVLVVRRGTLALPVDVELVAEDGTKKRVRWDDALLESDAFRIPYEGASPLRAAIVDPDEHVVLDQHPENNAITAVGAARAGAPRTQERALFWAGAIVGAIAP